MDCLPYSASRLPHFSKPLRSFVSLFFGLWVVLFEGGIADTSAPIARLLLFVGALGAGITFVGMEYFLFRFDDSHPLIYKRGCQEHFSPSAGGASLVRDIQPLSP